MPIYWKKLSKNTKYKTMALMDFFKKSATKDKEIEKPKQLEESYIKVTDQYRQFYSIDIGKWRQGHQSAIDPIRPRYDILMDVYEDATLDTHLSAMLQRRTLNVLNTEFKMLRNGEIDEELTSLFNKQWMYDVLKEIQNSIYWGFSPITFNFKADGRVKDIEVIRRNHFIPHRNEILPDLYSENTIVFTEPPFSFVNVLIKHKSLGLLLECAKYTIFKKHATAHWQQLQQLFGVPMRIGRTNSRKQDVMDKIYLSLKNMGSAGFGVFPDGTSIDIVENTKSDPYMIFEKAIEVSNREISNRIFGSHDANQSEGSFAREKVNYQKGNDITLADIRYHQFTINDVILPFLAQWNYDLDGATFQFVQNWQLPVANSQLDVDKWLSENYQLSIDYIKDKYGVPVEEKEKENIITKKKDDLKAFKSAFNDDFRERQPFGVVASANANDDLDEFIQNAFKRYFDKNIDRKEYFKTAEKLFENVKEGFEGLKYDNGSKDANWLMMQKHHVYAFSAAKTFSQLKEMQSLVFDQQGKKRPFTEFRADALNIYSKYNENWLQTEYDTMIRGTVLGRAWLDIQRDKDIYPYLRYRTAGDSRVRNAHEKLEGIVLRADDKLWEKIYPPNGWNCRCPKPMQLREDEITTDEKSNANSTSYRAKQSDLFDLEVTDKYWHRNTGIKPVLEYDETNYKNAMPKAANSLTASNYSLKNAKELVKAKDLPILQRDDYSLANWRDDMTQGQSFFDIETKLIDTTIRVDSLFPTNTDVEKWLTAEFENIILAGDEVWSQETMISFVKYYKDEAVAVIIKKGGDDIWYLSDATNDVEQYRKGVLLYSSK